MTRKRCKATRVQVPSVPNARNRFDPLLYFQNEPNPVFSLVHFDNTDVHTFPVVPDGLHAVPDPIQPDHHVVRRRASQL